MTEFYPGSRDAKVLILDHYHHHHNYDINGAGPKHYMQGHHLNQSNTVEPDHRNHTRHKEHHLMKSLSYPVPYNNHLDTNNGNLYSRNEINGRFIFNLSNNYAQHQHAKFYGNGNMPIYPSSSLLPYQMNLQPIYSNSYTYPMELHPNQMLNGENMQGIFTSTQRNKNSCQPAKQKENKHMCKIKSWCTKVFAPIIKIFPVIHALGSFLSRTTDVGTDALFATHLCSITGSCDCIWSERDPYGWPPWKGYAWGPTACWQTCSNYQTLETNVSNSTNAYPTHYCFAKENESRCSATPASSGLVHPLWCNSAIAFIVAPALIINCLYVYKARHLRIFKKIPVLLIILAIVPIFHFIWPVSYILQPILGESADFCHDITITTRIVGAIFESVPQFCLQNFVIMQSAFGDVVGIDNSYSPMAYISVLCSLCTNAYAVACFMGKDKKDKVVKFTATFITVGVRVTVNSMYGRHTFGLFMYALPMTSAFLFICICNFLYGLFCCKYTKSNQRKNTYENKINHSNRFRNDQTLDERKENKYISNAFPSDQPFDEGKENENASKISQISEHNNIFQNTWKTLGMYVISATCDGFTVNGLLAWIAFMPWVIWPFLDNLAIGMPEPGFTISVSVLSLACAGMFLNILILICNRCKT